MTRLGKSQGLSAPVDQSAPTALIAVVLVARSFGLELDVRRMIRDNHLIESRISSTELIRCIKSAGLDAIGLKPSWKGLANMSKALPALVRLNDGETLILLRVEQNEGRQQVLLQDPRANETTLLPLDSQRFTSIWNGELIIIKSGLKVPHESQPFTLRFIAGLIMRERRMLRDIAISAIMLSLLALIPILFYRLMTERVLVYHAMKTFVVVCLMTTLLVVFEICFGALRRYLLLRLTTRVDVKLTTEMFRRVLHLPMEYFEKTPAGLTLYRMGQLSRVRNFLVGQLFGTMLDAGVLLFFVPVMFYISPVLTSIVLTFSALICAWLIFMLPIYKLKSGEVERAESARGVFLSQSIQGIRTVKSLALEQHQIREWDALTARVARSKFEEGNTSNLVQVVVTPLERLMVTGSFAIGAYLALSATDVGTTNTLLTFMLLSQRLSSPLIQASQLINQYDEARTAVNVVGDLVNQPPEEGQSGSGVRQDIKGLVEFSGVQFRYKGALRPALKNATFEVPRGTTLGVMGRSGSGKTTITRLLQRLNTDYAGLVKVDGIDVRNYDLTHFRSSLGVVLQENFLFSGTIRANITIAKPEATFDEMIHAARLAGAEEFVEKLPAGYETYIYEGSPNLSGGQRQRLAIARALITDPKILILDEATSALDAESEAIVNANIERISQGRTVITISHRLASLVKADAILVMEQGEVNDIGKHHELLERNEIYANLWYTQNPHTAGSAAPRPQLTYRGPQSVA